MSNFKFKFHLFDEGDGAASTQGQEQGNTSVGNGPGSQVGTDNGAQGNPDAEFAAMIGKGGKYHDAYNRMFTEAMNKRFKNQEDAQSKINKIADDFSLAFAKYGVESGDFEGLREAMANDDAFYRTAAEQEGLTLEQYKAKLQLEVDAAKGRAIQEQIQQQEEYNETVKQWETEADELRQYFPNFDLGMELQTNERFAEYLDMGIPVHDAFFLTHRQEIMSGQSDAASRQATQKVVTTINQRQSRPAEGAMSSNPAVVKKRVPSKLTKEDWDELDRRVAAGEEIAI